MTSYSLRETIYRLLPFPDVPAVICRLRLFTHLHVFTTIFTATYSTYPRTVVHDIFVFRPLQLSPAQQVERE